MIYVEACFSKNYSRFALNYLLKTLKREHFTVREYMSFFFYI